MTYSAKKPRQVCVHLCEPFKTWNGELRPQHLSIDIDGDTLPELIEKLSMLQSTHGKELTLRINIVQDRHYDRDLAINVDGWREETPVEVQERLAQEQQRLAHNAKLLDLQIERLKLQRAKLTTSA